jgi:hypothetical protein
MTAFAGIMGAASVANPQAVSADLEADRRLQHPVTIHATEEPLRAVLARIGAEANVQLGLAPGYECRWINLRVRSIPLRTLMRRLAALFSDQWMAEPTKPARGAKGIGREPGYILAASPSRRARQRRAIDAWRTHLARSLIDEVRRLERGEFEDWHFDGMEGEHERRSFAADLRGRAGVLGGLSVEAVNQLIAGDTIRVRTADAQGNWGQKLYDFAANHVYLEGGDQRHRLAAQSVFEFSSRPYRARGHTLQDLRFSVGSPGGARAGFNVVVHPASFDKDLQSELDRILGDPREDSVERSRRFDDLHLASGEADWGNQVLSDGQILSLLGASLNADYLADAHIRPLRNAPDVSSLRPEARVSAVTEHLRSRWTVKDRLLIVRVRDWWIEDLMDPPATRTRSWMAELDRTGWPGLERMADVAQLNSLQLENLQRLVPGAEIAVHGWFRLWSGLSEAQRRQMLGSRGLSAPETPARLRYRLLTSEGGVSATDPFFAAALNTGRLYASETSTPTPVATFEVKVPRDEHGHVFFGGPFRHSFQLPQRRRPTPVRKP